MSIKVEIIDKNNEYFSKDIFILINSDNKFDMAKLYIGTYYHGYLL